MDVQHRILVAAEHGGKVITVSVGIEDGEGGWASRCCGCERGFGEREVENVCLDGGLYRVLYIGTLRLGGVKDEGPGEQRYDDSPGAQLEQKAAAFLVDQRHANQGHNALQDFDGDVARGRVAGSHSGLFEDDDQEAKDRVDAGCLIEAEDDTGEDEGDDVFSLGKRTGGVRLSFALVFGGERLHFAHLQLGFGFG